MMLRWMGEPIEDGRSKKKGGKKIGGKRHGRGWVYINIVIIIIIDER